MALPLKAAAAFVAARSEGHGQTLGRRAAHLSQQAPDIPLPNSTLDGSDMEVESLDCDVTDFEPKAEHLQATAYSSCSDPPKQAPAAGYVGVIPSEDRRASRASASSIITEDNLRLARLRSYLREQNTQKQKSLLGRVGMARMARMASFTRGAVQTRRAGVEQRSLWRFVHGFPFMFLSSCMIALNVVMIGVIADARLDASLRRTPVSPAWAYIEILFAIFFSAEVVLRILADRLLFFLGFEWRWNVFDLLLALFSVVDVILSKMANVAISDPSFARTLRFVRFLRIVRIARAVRIFHSLRIVVFAIIESMMSLVWCLLVVGLIIYMFALLFLLGVTEHVETPDWAANADREELLKYFGNVPSTALSLFMAISGGVDWHDAVRPLKSVHWIYQPLFTMYVFLMVIGVLNVVMGSFVAATAEITNRDRENCVKTELQSFEAYVRKLKNFFAEADKDSSGLLSWEEFQEHLKVPKVSAYFRALELDMSQANVLFKLLDRDGSGEISLDEFLAGCMRLKGQAKSLEVNMLLHENKRLYTRVTEFMEAILDAFPGQEIARSRRRLSTR